MQNSFAALIAGLVLLLHRHHVAASSSSGWDIILEHNCDGGVHLVPGTPLHMSMNIGALELGLRFFEARHPFFAELLFVYATMRYLSSR